MSEITITLRSLSAAIAIVSHCRPQIRFKYVMWLSPLLHYYRRISKNFSNNFALGQDTRYNTYNKAHIVY